MGGVGIYSSPDKVYYVKMEDHHLHNILINIRSKGSKTKNHPLHNILINIRSKIKNHHLHNILINKSSNIESIIANPDNRSPLFFFFLSRLVTRNSELATRNSL